MRAWMMHGAAAQIRARCLTNPISSHGLRRWSSHAHRPWCASSAAAASSSGSARDTVGDAAEALSDDAARDEREEALRPGLYVVGTPIGNMEDVTLRALRVLSSADTILAEVSARIASGVCDDRQCAGDDAEPLTFAIAIPGHPKDARLAHPSRRGRTPARRVLPRPQQAHERPEGGGEASARRCHRARLGRRHARRQRSGMRSRRRRARRGRFRVRGPGPLGCDGCAILQRCWSPCQGGGRGRLLLRRIPRGQGREQRAASRPRDDGRRPPLARAAPPAAFFAAPHDLVDDLGDLASCFGGATACVVCRELTKRHETYFR